jgi:hypothetical protein
VVATTNNLVDTFVLSLFIFVDVLGIVGAIMVAIPFLREHKLKELRDIIIRHAPLPGLENADKKAEQAVTTELTRFHRGDGAYVGWGLVVISVSYGLHIIAELLDHLVRTSAG